MSGKPTVVFITAISPELRAVRAYLENVEEIAPKGTIYYTGQFQATTGHLWQVSVVRIGPGNNAAAIETSRAIEFFNPSHVFFVGVAGGIKDVALGDIVAADKVYGYESGKQETTLKARPEVGQSTHAMVQRAMATQDSEEWLKKLERKPTAFVKPIAAGSKVLTSTSSAIYKFLQKTYNDAVAVEMEGIGFLDAIHRHKDVEAIVIRGISDLLDKKEEADAQGSQEIASQHAAAFAFAMLDKIKVTTQNTSPNTNPNQKSPSDWAFNILKDMLPAMFDEVMFHYGEISFNTLPSNAAQSQKAMALINDAKKRQGDGVEGLRQIIKDVANFTYPT